MSPQPEASSSAGGKTRAGKPRSLAVVIPYYQKEPGILARALRSVRAQTGLPDDLRVQVWVVDDESPCPPDADVAPFADGTPAVNVIEQPNAGPGGARNRALDALPADTDFVAFIDSDDEWRPAHLANAVRTLEQGFDFYFSDFYFCNYKEQSAFKRGGKLPVADHEPIEGVPESYAYQGDFGRQILVLGNVVGTSNAVYRFARFAEQRFTANRLAGEDYEFWLRLARAGGRIAFSTTVGCDCGLGVNVFARTEWGSAEHLVLLRDQLATWRAARDTFVRTAEQRAANEQRIARLRTEVWANLLHRLRHRQKIDTAVVGSILRSDPGVWCGALSVARNMLGRPARD